MSQHHWQQCHSHHKLKHKQLYSHFVIIVWRLWGKSLFIFSLKRCTQGTVFCPKHADNKTESFLNSAICTKVGFTHLWGFEIHISAESPEILYQGYHQGNILRLFLEMTGGKYLSKKADMVSCCPGTNLVFPPHENLSVCSLAWCNLRLCVTSELVNRWWWCLCLCTAFQSNHYTTYQPLKLWFWYSTDTPVISFQHPCDQSVCRFSLSQENIPHGQHCTSHCQVSHWPSNRESVLVKSGSWFNQATPPFTLCGYNWLWRNKCYKCCTGMQVEFRLD